MLGVSFGMGKLDSLVRHVLPQVLPCPRSMVMDALQTVTVDFCKTSEVWAEVFEEPWHCGEQAVEIGLPGGVEIVRVRDLWIDGNLVSRESFRTAGRSVMPGYAAPHNCMLHIDAVLRPSRLAENVPHALIEEWGDVLAYGALAKLKAMSGKNVEWSDGSGAALTMQLYNEGTARARVHVVRARNGGGALYAVRT